MNLVEAVVVIFAVIIVILVAAYTFTPIFSPQPVVQNGGAIVKSWNYCAQFDENHCNTSEYKDPALPNTVKCYWVSNQNTSKCVAGTGYQ